MGGRSGSELLHTGLAWAGAWFAGERTRLRREQIEDLRAHAVRAEREAERERQLAAAAECARIARDLHDSAGHAISLIAVRAGAARLRHRKDPDRSLAALEAIEEVARQTAAEIDGIVGSLRDSGSPNDVTTFPVGLASLDRVIARHRQAGLQLAFNESRTPRRLSAAADQAAFRILQEALTNAARHGSGSARIELVFGDEWLELTVTNPMPTSLFPLPRARGLVGMRERAMLLGGTLDVGRTNGIFSCARPPRVRRTRSLTRVLIADDEHLMRAGLAELLTTDPEIEIVGQASTGRDAVALAVRLAPDVVLMDVRMPDLDGIAATRELTRATPSARVPILTTFEQDDDIFGALRAGALCFLVKRTRPEELIAAVHTIAAGDALLSPSVTLRVIDRMAQQPTPQLADQPKLDELTAREREVLVLIARGLANREIATTLVVEESTVRTHVKRILMKLDLRDRVQAVIFAYESGVSGPAAAPGRTGPLR